MANKATYAMIKGAVSSGRTPSYVIDDEIPPEYVDSLRKYISELSWLKLNKIL